MKKTFTILLMYILLASSFGYSQKIKKKTGFWKISSWYGEARLNGFYRMQDRKGTQINEKQESTLFSGGLLLRTRNYIWHPRFLLIDIDGEYSPARANEKFIVIPDQLENTDIRKLDIALTLLPQNKFSIASYFNYGRIYNNRENLSNILSTGSNWGSTLFYRTKKIPFSIGYSSNRLDEKEILTGRNFRNEQKNLTGRFTTTFGKTDKQEMLLSHNEFFRRDFNKSEIFNKVNNMNFTSLFYFGVKKRNTINTLLSGYWQKGFDEFTRYQAIENINWELRKNITISTNYAFYSDKRLLQSLNQHNIGGVIRHQLFESLYSQFTYGYSSSVHNLYKQGLHQATIDLKYTKRLLKKHNLDLSYRHSLQVQKWNSDDGLIPVFNEVVQLKDGQITLLARPYITVSTVRVKDITGTIIYQENLDYLLLQQNSFLQIQRIPGGQILNNTAVYVDYTAIQPGTYDYTGTNYFLSAGLSLFNRSISFYYNRSEQDYQHLKNADFLTLNYFTDQVYGIKLDYKYLSGGVEYDNMNSTVLPYQLYRYFISLQGTIKKKTAISANGNLYDYKKLNNISNIQFADVGLTAVYQCSPKVALKGWFNYRKQIGDGFNLALLNFKTEVVANIHKLRFSVNYNYYDRTVFNEQIRFNAFNVQIARKF